MKFDLVIHADDNIFQEEVVDQSQELSVNYLIALFARRLKLFV